MRLIVGLGNPGTEYAGTRHNAGFMTLDGFAERHGFPPFAATKKAKGEVSRGTVGGEAVILLKPATFMNASGEAVAAALSFYKLAPKDLVLVHDELAFPVGTVRIAAKGSGGGHNGVQSVIDALGTEAFARVRVGIGPADARPVTMDAFVLERFRADERVAAVGALVKASAALDRIVEVGVAAATRELHA